MLYQLVSVLGAVMVLAAYVALQRRWLLLSDRWYYGLNFGGAALLTLVAVVHRQWGFILVEGMWALISIPPLLRPPTGDRIG
jgi:hypothetical protein